MTDKREEAVPTARTKSSHGHLIQKSSTGRAGTRTWGRRPAPGGPSAHCRAAPGAAGAAWVPHPSGAAPQGQRTRPSNTTVDTPKPAGAPGSGRAQVCNHKLKPPAWVPPNNQLLRIRQAPKDEKKTAQSPAAAQARWTLRAGPAGGPGTASGRCPALQSTWGKLTEICQAETPLFKKSGVSAREHGFETFWACPGISSHRRVSQF